MPEETPESIEDAWEREIERRMHEIETGTVKTIPWREVQRRTEAFLQSKDPRREKS
jgi:putative addiction module component (TIGR02574 family)